MLHLSFDVYGMIGLICHRTAGAQKSLIPLTDLMLNPVQTKDLLYCQQGNTT